MKIKDLFESKINENWELDNWWTEWILSLFEVKSIIFKNSKVNLWTINILSSEKNNILKFEWIIFLIDPISLKLHKRIKDSLWKIYKSFPYPIHNLLSEESQWIELISFFIADLINRPHRCLSIRKEEEDFNVWEGAVGLDNSLGDGFINFNLVVGEFAPPSDRLPLPTGGEWLLFLSSFSSFLSCSTLVNINSNPGLFSKWNWIKCSFSWFSLISTFSASFLWILSTPPTGLLVLPTAETSECSFNVSSKEEKDELGLEGWVVCNWFNNKWLMIK